jgi:hypothetical protein
VIQVTCTTCLEARLRDGLCRCVARRLRDARTGRARVMPWSGDASVPGTAWTWWLGRVAQSLRELIPHTFTSDSPAAMDGIRRHRHGNAENRRPAPAGDRRSASAVGHSFVGAGPRRATAPRFLRRAATDDIRRDLPAKTAVVSRRPCRPGHPPGVSTGAIERGKRDAVAVARAPVHPSDRPVTGPRKAMP